MRITKETIKKETVEIEVDLPYFAKDEDTYYCILDEENMLKVQFLEYTIIQPSVRISYASMISFPNNSEHITHNEFLEAYQKASDFLSDEFEKMRDILREKQTIFINPEIDGK